MTFRDPQQAGGSSIEGRSVGAALSARIGPHGGQPIRLADHRLCICGHKRHWHKFCSHEHPTVCCYEIAPSEDWPICSCLQFEEDE